MTLQQYLPVFWERRRLIFTVYLLTVVLTLAVSLAMPKKYTASVSMLVDVKNDPVSGTVLPDMTSQNYMANQVAIMQSDRVAARVARLLDPAYREAAMERWEKSQNRDIVPFEQFYVDWLKEGLKVKTTPINNLMTLTYTGPQAQLTADTANAFSQAYIETAIDLRVEPARLATAWYDERLSNLRAALKKAKGNLSAYQKEKGILASDSKDDQETALLAALTAKLAEVQKRRIDTGTRQSGGADEASPNVVDNKVIQEIRTELRAAQAKFNEMSLNAGVNYPPRMHLESRIASLKQQLNEEIRRIPDTRASVNRATAQQEAELRKLIAAQQARVLALLAEHDDIAMLVKDVETAQHAYDAVAQRTSQVSLESKAQHANVSVLTAAQLPTTPARPRVLLNFLISHPAGLLLGILLAMAIESLDRRVRSIHDLSVDDLPVLGVLQPEPSYSRINQLLSGVIASPRSLPYKGPEPS